MRYLKGIDRALCEQAAEVWSGVRPNGPDAPAAANPSPERTRAERLLARGLDPSGRWRVHVRYDTVANGRLAGCRRTTAALEYTTKTGSEVAREFRLEASAVCMPLDRFERAEGRRIALCRLEDALMSTNLRHAAKSERGSELAELLQMEEGAIRPRRGYADVVRTAVREARRALRQPGRKSAGGGAGRTERVAGAKDGEGRPK